MNQLHTVALQGEHGPDGGADAGAAGPALQEDIARLKEAEAAYEAEFATTDNFTPAPQEESHSSDREPELAEQTA